jgi:dTDP-4-amino-4,6-dideoxygalactose transaminase
LRPPTEPNWARSNWQSYCVTLPASADQERVMQVLLDRGISTRRGVMNSHLEPAYGGRGMYRANGSLARSETAQHTSIVLPLFAQMSEDDVRYVADELVQSLTVKPVDSPGQGRVSVHA